VSYIHSITYHNSISLYIMRLSSIISSEKSMDILPGAKLKTFSKKGHGGEKGQYFLKGLQPLERGFIFLYSHTYSIFGTVPNFFPIQRNSKHGSDPLISTPGYTLEGWGLYNKDIFSKTPPKWFSIEGGLDQ